MSGDPLKLVKFVCVAKPHARRGSDAALTIHQGVWAFCPLGGDQTGHDWQPTDGLPLTEALRFAPRHLAPGPPPAAPAQSAKPTAPVAAKSRARSR